MHWWYLFTLAVVWVLCLVIVLAIVCLGGYLSGGYLFGDFPGAVCFGGNLSSESFVRRQSVYGACIDRL